jgi:hypothetical protein
MAQPARPALQLLESTLQDYRLQSPATKGLRVCLEHCHPFAAHEKFRVALGSDAALVTEPEDIHVGLRLRRDGPKVSKIEPPRSTELTDTLWRALERVWVRPELAHVCH